MNLRDLNIRKTPVVVIDESLAKFKDKQLFPEKLEKANEVLRKFGVPKLKEK